MVTSAESSELESNQGCGKYGRTTLEKMCILSAQGEEMAFCIQSITPPYTLSPTAMRGGDGLVMTQFHSTYQ